MSDTSNSGDRHTGGELLLSAVPLPDRCRECDSLISLFRHTRYTKKRSTLFRTERTARLQQLQKHRAIGGLGRSGPGRRLPDALCLVRCADQLPDRNRLRGRLGLIHKLLAGCGPDHPRHREGCFKIPRPVLAGNAVIRRAPTSDLHVHGFLTVDGQKISKSLGNAVDPLPVIERYGPDALRYYLLRHVSPTGDSDFSHSQFAEIYENDLANGLGNLVARLEALSVKAGLNRIDGELRDPVPPPNFEGRRFNTAIEVQWNTVHEINRDIEVKRPWEYLAADRREELVGLLKRWILQLLQFARTITPILPATSAEIEKRFTSHNILRNNPLFPRL